MYITFSGAPTVADCVFSNNSAENTGGGIWNEGGFSSLTATNCTFNDNVAGAGGGMDNNGNATLTNCTFTGNSATGPGMLANGGAIRNASATSKGNLTLTNCMFTNNIAVDEGGALWNDSEINMSGCAFSGSRAPLGPGVVNRLGGLLFGEGSIGDGMVNGGALFPGTDFATLGAATVTGDYSPPTEGSSGFLIINIGGLTPGTEHDLLEVSETATLAGLLLVTLIEPFMPELGNSFEIVTAQSIRDQFDVALLPGLPGGLFMKVEYNTGPPPLGPTGDNVTIIVESLEGVFEGFEDPESVEISGVPTGGGTR